MALRKNPLSTGNGRPPKDKDNLTYAKRKTKNEVELSASRSETAKKTGLGGRVELTEEQRRRNTENRTKPRMRPAEAAELSALWESGEFTLSELATRFKRDPSALSRFFSINGVIKGAKAEEYARKIQERILEEMLGDASETASRIRKLKDDYLTRIDIIKKLSHKQIVDTQTKGLSLQAALPNLRALKELLGIYTTCRTEEYELLGVIDFENKIEQDNVPELLVSELSNEDIENLRTSQTNLNSLDEIDVIDMEDIGVIDES